VLLQHTAHVLVFVPAVARLDLGDSSDGDDVASLVSMRQRDELPEQCSAYCSLHDVDRDLAGSAGRTDEPDFFHFTSPRFCTSG